MARALFNCSRCPAYCCSYPHVAVTKRDLRRIAKRFGIAPDEAHRRFTKQGQKKNERSLRHRWDEIFGSTCRFLDRELRQCTIYDDRPAICRQFPGSGRCGYYDFLAFERRMLDDPEHIAVTRNA